MLSSCWLLVTWPQSFRTHLVVPSSQLKDVFIVWPPEKWIKWRDTCSILLFRCALCIWCMEPAKQVENLHQGYQNTSFGHRDQDLCKGIALWAITNKEETQREETLDSSLFIINFFQVYLGILFLFLEGWRFGLGFGLEPHGFPPSFSKKTRPPIQVPSPP